MLTNLSLSHVKQPNEETSTAQTDPQIQHTMETRKSNNDHKSQTSVITKSSTIRAKTKPNAKPQSHFRTQFDSISIRHHLSNPIILARDFYQINALELAPLLLGKYLRRDDVVLQITEVTK